MLVNATRLKEHTKAQKYYFPLQLNLFHVALGAPKKQTLLTVTRYRHIETSWRGGI